MSNFEKMYFLLFNCITDALTELELQNYGTAKELLMQAQQRTEEAYMDSEEVNI